MGYTAVTYNFVNGTVADADQVDTNFNDLVIGLSDGTKDINVNAATFGGAADFNSSVALGTDVSYERAPISLYRPQTVSMAYASASTITIKAGRYFLNNKVYVLSGDLTWAWVASGQNGGLDTGAEASSTFYYMYGTLIGGAFGAVASTTAPTAQYDTNLSGTSFDTNVYLGAFYNNSASDIVKFIQCGAQFYYDQPQGAVSTTSTVYQSKTMQVPTTANVLHLGGQQTGNANGNDIIYSVDGTNEWSRITGNSAGIRNYGNFSIPLFTAQTIYMKVDSNADTNSSWALGWIDKWL